MKFSRMSRAGLLAAALGLAGSAQANDNIYWSVGVFQPGISVGVSNAPPMPVYPAPVYVVPRPIHYHYAPPVFQGLPPGWHRGNGHGHFKHGHGQGYGHYKHGHGGQRWGHGPHG